MPHAQYLKGTEDRKTSVFLPDLPWYLPVGADGRLAELQAEAFHGAVPVPPRLPPPFRPGIQTASPLTGQIGSKTIIYERPNVAMLVYPSFILYELMESGDTR